MLDFVQCIHPLYSRYDTLFRASLCSFSPSPHRKFQSQVGLLLSEGVPHLLFQYVVEARSSELRSSWHGESIYHRINLRRGPSCTGVVGNDQQESSFSKCEHFDALTPTKRGIAWLRERSRGSDSLQGVREFAIRRFGLAIAVASNL